MTANKKTRPIRLKSGLLAAPPSPLRAPTNDGLPKPILSVQNQKFDNGTGQMVGYIANNASKLSAE